jgi:hypothetical protein
MMPSTFLYCFTTITLHGPLNAFLSKLKLIEQFLSHAPHDESYFSHATAPNHDHARHWLIHDLPEPNLLPSKRPGSPLAQASRPRLRDPDDRPAARLQQAPPTKIILKRIPPANFRLEELPIPKSHLNWKDPRHPGKPLKICLNFLFGERCTDFPSQCGFHLCLQHIPSWHDEAFVDFHKWYTRNKIKGFCFTEEAARHKCFRKAAP